MARAIVGQHRVSHGECLSSISASCGHHWRVLWEHEANAELKRRRGDPNVLMEGDVVHIAALEPRQKACETGRRHRFRRMGIPPSLDLRLLFAGSPRANEPYVLEIGGRRIEGRTDGEGRLRQPVPADAHEARLVLRSGEEVHVLRLGTLDPIDEERGVLQRLSALGYGGRGAATPEAVAASVAEFQRARGLEPRGTVDDATRAALRQAFGA